MKIWCLQMKVSLHFMAAKTGQNMFSYAQLSLCIFCLVVVLCIFSCAGNSNLKSCAETDKQALLKLKNGFADEGNILSSWEREVDCCKWKGISCNNLTGRVTHLNLTASDSSAKLKGTINASLCELQHLTLLDLSFNDFEGQMIPKCIGSLGHLTVLKLRKAKLSGIIPSELQNLSNIQTLDLGGNYNLISSSLAWVSHLSSLRYVNFNLVDLRLATDWQSSISNIPSLLELHLDETRLPQVNPQSFSYTNSSSHLKILSLGRNQLNSLTLSWVFKLSKALVHLDLSSNSLQNIPSNAFINMTSLQYLDLHNNKLEIDTIKFVCNLCQLKVLLLSNNYLSGQINQWIRQPCCVQNGIEELDLTQNPFNNGPFPNFSTFSSLVRLRLRETNLYGSISHMIPQSFRPLRSLKHLDLSYNYLSGLLPEFTQFTSLETLDLSKNEFNGTLPWTVGQLSSLSELIISSNKLSGVINEAHLSSLSNLKVLDVSCNSISFNFNSNWLPSFQLYELSASSCNLGPNFPRWLRNQKRLEWLDISRCGIFDSTPEWFWGLSPGLKYLDFSDNKIHGNLTNLLTQKELHVLDMSNNSLSGTLPNCWEHFQDLKVLSLGHNNLSGRIPSSVDSLENSKVIMLNDNNFYGEMPSFTHSTRLKLIDFGQNNLSGNLPKSMGINLPNLIVLDLRENKLQGSIPTSLCNLEQLKALDLAHNEITGIIPHCLDQIVSMTSNFSSDISHSTNEDNFRDNFLDNFVEMYFEKPRDQFSFDRVGTEVILPGLPVYFLIGIDLSSNHLQGEIPDIITKLLALHLLNLSNNNLTGFIPNNMGQLQDLELLDLSRNYLSGGIPASFSSLHYLTFLDLSFNSLSGEIPRGSQLDTFGAYTYTGNQGLCGPPLSQDCPREAPSSDHSDPDQLISLGFYISMFFGFTIGFWGVCGTLILKSSWRQAYFQFFSDMNDWIYVQAFLFMARLKRRFQHSEVPGGANR